mmetsp:Transcript_116000/g.324434  ORF Transcript_116000/g.324434 Transcript_116000/m.324434 type:complete len:212 (+) Transcript_116000:809-1444(+)
MDRGRDERRRQRGAADHRLLLRHLGRHQGEAGSPLSHPEGARGDGHPEHRRTRRGGELSNLRGRSRRRAAGADRALLPRQRRQLQEHLPGERAINMLVAHVLPPDGKLPHERAHRRADHRLRLPVGHHKHVPRQPHDAALEHLHGPLVGGIGGGGLLPHIQGPRGGAIVRPCAAVGRGWDVTPSVASAKTSAAASSTSSCLWLLERIAQQW